MEMVTSAAQLKEAVLKDPLVRSALYEESRVAARVKQVVVHCEAEWSEPCRQMSAVFKELASMHPSIKFLAVDIENVTYVQKEYNVQAVPHFLFFKQGKVVDRSEGADPSVLLQKLDSFATSAPPKTEQLSLNQRIEKLVGSSDVMLFMKGSPDAPRCGFSSRVVQALNEAHVEFSHFDILQDEAIRQGLKEYSCWPTYPQLYVKGEFLGGCDIITELKEKKQLQQEIVKIAGEGVLSETMDQKCERLTKRAPVVLFMKGSPSAPRCKFSTRVVAALNEIGIQFRHFDILQDEAVRQGLKIYSQWPTYPQLYVEGRFMGGCDVIEEMHSKGELASHFTSLLQSQKSAT